MLTRAQPVASARSRRVVVPDAAGQLDLQPHRAGDLGDDLGVVPAAERGVQVHQVDPLRAGALPALGGHPGVAEDLLGSGDALGPVARPGHRTRPRPATTPALDSVTSPDDLIVARPGSSPSGSARPRPPAARSGTLPARQLGHDQLVRGVDQLTRSRPRGCSPSSRNTFQPWAPMYGLRVTLPGYRSSHRSAASRSPHFSPMRRGPLRPEKGEDLAAHLDDQVTLPRLVPPRAGFAQTVRKPVGRLLPTRHAW